MTTITPSTTTIICGVNCACAPAQEPCSAKETCLYSATCKCAPGTCQNSKLKTKCATAASGQCSCAAGSCARADAMRAACPTASNGSCNCAPGCCKAAATAAGADPRTVPTIDV